MDSRSASPWAAASPEESKFNNSRLLKRPPSLGAASPMSAPAASPLRPNKRAKMELETTGPLSRIAAEHSVRRMSGELSTVQIREADAQSRISELEGIIKGKDARIERLERDRQALLDRAQDKAEDKEDAANEVWTKEKSELERSVQKLRVENSELQDTADSAAKELRTLQHSASLLEDSLEALQRNYTALQNELQTTLNLVGAKTSEVDKLQDELASLKTSSTISSHESPTSSKSKDAVIQLELKRQSKHIKSLEATIQRVKAENEALKTRDISVGMLREQVKALEAKVRAGDELRHRLAEVEVERDILVSEQSEWTVYLAQTPENFEKKERNPHHMAATIARLRLDLDNAKSLHTAKDGDIQSRDQIIAELEANLDEALSIIDETNLAKIQAEVHLQSERRASTLSVQERDFLKTQLDTYSAEEASLIDPALYDNAKTERIRQLETAVKESRDEQTTLKNDLQQAQSGALATAIRRHSLPEGSSVSAALTKLTNLSSELLSTQRDLAMAQKSKESLEITVSRLSHLLGAGAYDPSTTQVLCLRDNPADADLAVRTSLLDDLKAENKALLSRLDDADAMRSNGSVPRETLANLNQQIEQLKQEISKKEKASQRLNEAFRAKAMEFRNAVAILCGYKVDVKESGQIRLTSIFAMSATKHLLFELEPNPKGGKVVKLVGGAPLTENEQRDFSFWVTGRQSWPGFLASILMTQYEEATRGGKHLGFVDG